jgi:putative transposon-encoded protein
MISFENEKILAMMEKIVKAKQNTGYIYVPKKYIGKKVYVLVEKRNSTIGESFSKSEMDSIRKTLNKSLNESKEGLHYGYIQKSIKNYQYNLESIELDEGSTHNLIMIMEKFNGDKEIIKKIKSNIQ